MFDLATFIQAAGYIGIAAMVFAESGLFFGFFFPGDSLLFTAGFLASQGYFNIWVLVALSMIFGILGDSVGYWFGKKIGPMIFTKTDSFWFSKKRITDTEHFFARHGGKSLILARFIPAVRTFTPIIAGVGKMRYGAFLAYNIIGGILWGAGIPTIGYYLGRVVPGIDRYILPLVGLIIIITTIPVVWGWWKYRNHKG